MDRFVSPCTDIAECTMHTVVDGVSPEPLHSHGASAQNTSIHVHADTAAGRPVWFRLRTDTVSQDGLSRSTPCHAANTVTGHASYSTFLQ